MMIDSALNKILEHGVIHVGFQRHTPPFSYSTDQEFKPLGYSVDLCRWIIASIGEELNLGEIKIIPVEVTSSNRLAFLEQGLIDIECGSTTNTTLRQQLSLFSNSIFYTSHRILFKAQHLSEVSPISRALTITGIEKSTSHSSLIAWKHFDWDFNFVGCPSIFSAFEKFKDDPCIDAIIADEVILKSLTLQTKIKNSNYLPYCLGGEPYGFMIRKDDFSFKSEVDSQLSKVFKLNEFTHLYDKWFMQTIPSLEFNLDMPMSDSLRNLIQAPNDRAI